MDVIYVWELSGSRFALVGGAALAAAVVVPVILAEVLCRLSSPRGTGRPLSPYEIACLRRGPGRVALVAVTELSWHGALYVRSTGRVQVADRAAWSGLEAEGYGIGPDAIPDGARAATVVRRLRRTSGVRRVRRRLEAEGLLVSGARLACVRWLPTVALAVVLAGETARLCLGVPGGSGAAEQSWVFFFVTLLLMTAVIPLTAGRPVRRTRRGSAVLRRTARPARGPENVLLLVALDGVSGVPALALRNALLAGLS